MGLLDDNLGSGLYGKGDEGYAHYMQAVNESQKGSSGGGPQRSNNGGNSGGCIFTVILAILIYAIIKMIVD